MSHGTFSSFPRIICICSGLIFDYQVIITSHSLDLAFGCCTNLSWFVIFEQWLILWYMTTLNCTYGVRWAEIDDLSKSITISSATKNAIYRYWAAPISYWCSECDDVMCTTYVLLQWLLIINYSRSRSCSYTNHACQHLLIYLKHTHTRLPYLTQIFLHYLTCVR